MAVYKCPFCGESYDHDGAATSKNGAVGEVTVLSIECPCGATFALTRGGRPHARSD